MQVVKRRLVALSALCLALFGTVISFSDSAYGIATQSSISMSIQSGTLSVEMLPSIDGEFADSGNATLSIATDNFTGYNLSINTSGGTSLVSENNDTIPSISSEITPQAFSTSSTYNNKWGFKPSQYISSSGGVETVVNNLNYLPAPSGQGLVLAKTTAANSVANTYTFSFGVRLDFTKPAGTYVGTYVVTAVANSIVYNVTYNANSQGTVGSMPSPNPQAFEIDGGTPVADSYGTLSSAVPTLADKTFGGWCSVQPTYNSTTQNDECSGTTYAAGAQYPIDQTADGTNITLYAIWITDPFPTVWSQMGKCVFDHGNISGSECQDHVNDSYIDTGIALYSNANYQKDYEVHFTIDVFNPNSSVQTETQTTMFNDKLSSSVTGSPYGGKSPGIVVRTTSSHTFEIKSTYGAPTDHAETRDVAKTPYATAYNGTDVRVFRINGHIYTSIDNEPLVELQDYTSFDQQFGLTAWFGAYPDNVNCTENCTAAKRYFTGEMSNMYIKLGDFDENNLHEIIFDENYGSTPDTTTYLVLDGDTVSPLPTPTRTDWTFDGWWTAASGGTEKTAPYTPTASEHLYAHWYKSVSEAQITNSSISLSVSDTETIQITNSADLEPYTFTSSDDTIATVNSSGLVTAVSNGVATITMTGTKTGDTKTITVTVGSVIVVTFDPDYGSEATFTENVASGDSFSSLPTYSRTGYELEGWYTGQGGTGTKLTTSTVFSGSTPTTYYANWTAIPYVCKIATTRHFETCTQASGYGCRKAGWATDARIDYGYLITNSSPVTAGAAYDCDVDYDGTYDDETERFYYFGTENGNAKLVHYINQQNNASVAYDVAASYLPNYELDQQNPTIPVWDNPNLVTYDSGTFAGKAARFMTYEEVYDLWTGGSGKIKPSDYSSVFLFENTNFATTGRTDGIWLHLSANNGKNRIQTSSLTLTHNGNTSANASRATIEVPTQYMEPYTAPATDYTITFNPHNETATWTETVTAGNTLGNAYPATDPTYTNHIFQGWYTAASGGTLVTSSTQPSGDTTYHAQWKGTVALATLASNSISVEEGDTETITVTNSADIESYGFASLDSTIATVDPTTGVVTGMSAGTTSIRMTGASSLTFIDIPVTVTAAPVTYTIYFNPHNGSANSSATVTAGSTIGSSNIPADPTPSGADEVFMGWFTAASGGTAVDGNTTPNADGETYHAQYMKIVCKLATAGTLHTATKTSNSTNTSPYYGQIANDPIPHAGDAYNCDVDYDDTYSAVNERFYYVGQDSNNNAVLVAWNSYYGGGWAPGTSSDSIYSYTDALQQLPANTSGAWDNPGLIEQETGKAARFTTRAEVIHACGDISVTSVGALDDCDYFMEHSAYDSGGRSALWLMKEGSSQYRIHGGISNRQVGTSTGTSMVRPTIVVPDKLVEKYVSQELDVTNAVIANDLILAVGDQITIVVSNSAALEPYTFSSDDTSIATVDSATGTVTGVNAGTVDIIMSGSHSGLTKTLEVEVSAAGELSHTVTFNTNGGTLNNGASSTRSVDDGDTVGALPTASKTNYAFFGWYTDDGTFYEEVYADEVIEDDVTFYAKWVENTSSFPIVWSEINECTFTGTTVTGTYCNNTNNSKYYIDSNIQLFTAANYGKDYEVGFTITEYDPTNQLSGGGNQATFVSTKKEDSGNQYPGFVVRRYSGTNYIEITSRWKGDGQSLALSNFPSATTKTVKLQKRKETEQGNDYHRIYYSINGGAWTLYEDVTNKTHFEFNTKIWFGGAEAANGTSAMRPLVGKMTDMYVKLGVDSEYLVNLEVNGGTLPSGAQSSYTINAGDPVGALPTPTAPSANYTFDGWYDGNTLVSDGTQYIPTSNVTLTAHWTYVSSDTPVVFDVSNNATRGYQALSAQWAQSPVNLTTFNKDTTTINNSTWGDTSELSELQYWTAIRNNFVNNECFIQTSTAHNTNSDAVKPLTALSNWTSGSVDCSKPDAYDTKIDAALTVRLNNSQGAVVAYAKAENGIIHNMIPGQTYYWEKTSDSTVYGYVTAVSNGSSTGTRWVDTDVVRNVRDLGGLPVSYTDSNNQTVTGTLAYGRLFRGEKLQNVSASELTNLGITTEYNVGDEYSGDTHLSDYHLNNVIHYDFDYNSGDESNASSNYMKAWNAVTNIMTDIVDTNSTKNIYFHCRVGADRTGTVAYLLEGLLGVPDDQRYEEYGLTNVSGLYDRTRYYKQKASNNANKFVYMMDYVLTNQDIYDWYMHGPNASSSLIDDFRAAMTIPIQSQSPSPAPGEQNNGSGSQQAQSLMNASLSGNANSSSQSADSEDSSTASSNTTESNPSVTASNSSDYAEPLGVHEETSNSGLNAAGLAIASAVVVGAGGLTYAYASHNKNED